MSNKATPVNEEMSWDKSKTIKSKTDNKGTITYVNDVFVDVSEFSKEELIGQPHNIVRHPDTPKVIFKTLWKNLKEGNNFNAVVKNMTKSGKYYWIVTNFDIFKDSTGSPNSFMGVRQSVPEAVITEIEALYNDLLESEKSGGMDASEAKLNEYLADKGGDYSKYIKTLLAKHGVTLGF